VGDLILTWNTTREGYPHHATILGLLGLTSLDVRASTCISPSGSMIVSLAWTDKGTECCPLICTQHKALRMNEEQYYREFATHVNETVT
jgi:hypothetical protein